MVKLLHQNKGLPTTKGSVLVLVLVVLSSMTILSVALAYRTRIEIKIAQSYAQRTKAYYLARAGIERARAHLGEREITPANMAYICSLNTTAREEKLFDGLDVPQLYKHRLWFCVRDEQGCLNLNKSDPASWTRIENLSKSCCAGILDWQDEDDQTSSEGAETEFYQRLEPPYIAKNSDILLLKELLYVKDIAAQLYLGEDHNHNDILDENETDGSLIPPPDNGDDRLDSGLIDIFTVYGNGRININTASRTVLAALPGLDEGVADAIISHRTGPDYQLGTEDDICFEDISDLAQLQELSSLQIELLEQYCCFTSRYFRVFSRATLPGGIECSLLAMVCCSDADTELITLERLPQ